MVERAPGPQVGRCSRDLFFTLGFGPVSLLTLYAK